MSIARPLAVVRASVLAVVSGIALVVAAPTPLAAQGDATFTNGRYTRAGISVTLPPEGVYQQTRPATPTAATPTEATAQWLMQPVTAYPASLYVRTSTQDTPDIEAAIASAVATKEGQRRRDGYQQWRARPQGVRRLTIGGHAALLAVADWRRGDGEARVEYLAWVFTANRQLLLFANRSPGEEATLQPVFERIAQSATLP